VFQFLLKKGKVRTDPTFLCTTRLLRESILIEMWYTSVWWVWP